MFLHPPELHSRPLWYFVSNSDFVHICHLPQIIIVVPHCPPVSYLLLVRAIFLFINP